MPKNKFLISMALFFISVTFAIAIQNLRANIADLNSISSIIFGSAPSFLYVFGSLALIPVIKPNLTYSAYVKAALFFTLGACIYEITQLWTNAEFDPFDLFASAIAFVIMIFVYRVTSNSINTITKTKLS